MASLDDLRPSASVRGILPDCAVEVVNVKWFGSEALELTYKDAGGKVGNLLLYRHDEPRLKVVQTGRSWSFDGDGALYRLVAEAHRIRLANLIDPVLAAIGNGDRLVVHARLRHPLEGGVDRPHLEALIEDRACAYEAVDLCRVSRVPTEMQRSEARCLQPHFIESFHRLRGTVVDRVPRCDVANHVPALPTAHSVRSSPIARALSAPSSPHLA